MRILVITSVYPRHDGDDQVPWMREAYRHIKNSGVEVEILAPSHRGIKSHTIDGIVVHRFRYGPASWETLTGEEGAPSKLRRNPFLKFLATAYLWCGFWKLVKLLFKKKYDLIEVHWPFPHAFMALPAMWAGVTVVYHYHSAELKLAAQSKFSNLIFSFTLPWARAHIANSSYTASLIKKLQPKLNIDTIPYGAAIRTTENKKRESFRKILFVGRHIERKGIRYLIEAFQQLPEDFSLTIVGEGDQTDDLKLQASGNSRIHFLGRLLDEQLSEVYSSHDIFVLPAIIDSRGDTEGLGVVLVEAIAAGLVVIASNVGGIPDVIINEKTGLLVPQKNTTALKEAILRLAENPILAKELIHNAQAYCTKNFSWGSVTQSTLSVYAKVLRKTSEV